MLIHVARPPRLGFDVDDVNACLSREQEEVHSRFLVIVVANDGSGVHRSGYHGLPGTAVDRFDKQTPLIAARERRRDG